VPATARLLLLVVVMLVMKATAASACQCVQRRLNLHTQTADNVGGDSVAAASAFALLLLLHRLVVAQTATRTAGVWEGVATTGRSRSCCAGDR